MYNLNAWLLKVGSLVASLLNCSVAVPVTTILNKPAVSIFKVVPPRILVSLGYFEGNLKS